MLDWTPTIGIFNYPRVHAMRSKVGGYVPWVLGYPRFWLVSMGGND